MRNKRLLLSLLVASVTALIIPIYAFGQSSAAPLKQFDGLKGKEREQKLTEGEKKKAGKTLGDPDVVADVKKKKLEIDPTNGDELETLAKEVIASDREIIDRMKSLLGK